MVRLKRQMKCRSRQWCASNAKWGAAVANGAPQTPNEVRESSTWRLKRQMKCGSRQWCRSDAKWGAAVANGAPQTPNETRRSPMVRLKRQTRCSSRQCCFAGDSKAASVNAIVFLDVRLLTTRSPCRRKVAIPRSGLP